MNRTHAIVATYMGRSGQNRLVVEKIGDLEKSDGGFSDGKAVHFLWKDELRQLPGEDMGSFLPFLTRRRSRNRRASRCF